MRNLSPNEISLVSGANNQYVVVNTPNPNHFSDPFIAGMKGEPYSSIGSILGCATIGGFFGALGGPAGSLVGTISGGLWAWAYVNSEYSHGHNYLEAKKLTQS